MSSIIITTKPEVIPIVARSALPAVWDSGISSSTTTNIMAPAAILSAYGSMGSMKITAAVPIIPATGSTMADT